MKTMRNICRGPRRKKQPSMLDPHMDHLLGMFDKGNTLAEMQAWLLTQNPPLETCDKNLSRVLRHRSERREHEKRLSGIYSLGELCKSLDKAFTKNPAPALKTIIGVFKSEIMKLAARAANDPQYLKIADQLARTAIGFLAEESRVAFKEREVAIKEQKFAESKKTNR